MIFPSTRYQPSIWAIIPAKPLYESKTRLSKILSAVERAELMHSLLLRTLTILNQVVCIDKMLVVSSDPTISVSARNHGAIVLDEGEPKGLNVAVTRAVKLASINRATAAVILPIDLPFMEVKDVEMLAGPKKTQNGNDRQLALCPDNKNDGTNAVFIDLPTQFKFQYGEGSFQRHLQEATRLGLSTRLIHAPGLKFDLDTEDDWYKYRRLMKGQEQMTKV